MLKITKRNSWDLEYLFDELRRVIDEGWEIIRPKLLSINHTDKKYSQDGGKSYITVQETLEWEEIIENPKTIFLSLLIKEKEETWEIELWNSNIN